MRTSRRIAGEQRAGAPPTLGERVYFALTDEIASGTYAVNSRLPGELALARRFGVSRPVLRQALARLRAEGIVVARQGAGNFVARKEERGALSYGPLQSLPDVQRCLEFRCGLESDAARLAAIASDDQTCEAIERAMRTMEKTVASGQLPVEADFEFHLEIARASRNRFFVMTLDALRPHVVFGINLIRSLSTAPLDERRNTVLAEHRSILQAIRDKQPERAHEAMTKHLEAGIARLFSG